LLGHKWSTITRKWNDGLSPNTGVLAPRARLKAMLECPSYKGSPGNFFGKICFQNHAFWCHERQKVGVCWCATGTVKLTTVAYRGRIYSRLTGLGRPVAMYAYCKSSSIISVRINQLNSPIIGYYPLSNTLWACFFSEGRHSLSTASERTVIIKQKCNSDIIKLIESGKNSLIVFSYVKFPVINVMIL